MTDRATCDIKLPPLIDAIVAVAAKKPIVFASLDGGADVPAHYVEALRGLGVPYFGSAERAFRAVSRVRGIAALAARDTSHVVTPAVELPRGTVAEYAAKDVLAQIGIPMSERRFVRTCAEACDAAATIGFPVVLKAQSADLSHKTDAGGVVLHIGDERALTQGWAKLHRDIAAARPGVALDGVLVERMAPRGLELIVGGRNDREWGAVVLVGSGGALAEALADVRVLPADLSTAAIESALFTLQSAALLRGFRGSPALASGAVADVVARVGAFLRARPEIAEIDINPLVVYADRVLALDALMVVRRLEADAVFAF